MNIDTVIRKLLLSEATRRSAKTASAKGAVSKQDRLAQAWARSASREDYDAYIDDADRILGTNRKVLADYRDTDDLLDQLKEALSAFGLTLYDDPSTEGSDQLGFFIAKK